jgi:phospholipid/cholesterol/gamma-HCH transport system substrate-binding protein
LKLSKEIKTAILVIASILLFIWGYSFLKGSNLFTDYKTLYVQYDNIEGLGKSALVTINGLQVGKIADIKIENNTGKLTVEMHINNDFPISKSSIAEIYSPSPIGGKQISILPNLADKTETVSGDFLKAATKAGMLDALVGQIGPIKNKIDVLLDNANVMLSNINQVLDEKTKANLKGSIENLNTTLAEFSSASKNVNLLLTENKSKINGSVTDLKNVTANFSKISDSLAQIKLGKTLKNFEKTLAKVDLILADLQNGKGTMGKLLKDQALYTNFTKTSKELELLLQDVRLNPTRYINVSLFGKKNKPYVPIIQDSINLKK